MRQHGCASYSLFGATFSFSDGRSLCRRKNISIQAGLPSVSNPGAFCLACTDGGPEHLFCFAHFLVFTHEARPPFLSQYPPPFQSY